jgi:extradiol dioxygenase family protein
MRSLFHFAFNVTDLDMARRFYGGVLGCKEGRSTATWVDFDFFGHQISLHLGEPFKTAATGHVGEHRVPMPHFGLILALPDWQAMAERLQAARTDFVLKPHLRFEGQPGEQWTMFFLDPFGNPIEVKGFALARTGVRPMSGTGQRRAAPSRPAAPSGGSEDTKCRAWGHI